MSFKPAATNPFALPFDPARRQPAELEVPNYVRHVIASTSREDMALINKITTRVADIAVAYGKHGFTVFSTMQLGLDLAMAHSRQPLELLRLLMSSDDDVTHDVLGIARSVDRLTGHLRDGFECRHWRRPS